MKLGSSSVKRSVLGEISLYVRAVDHRDELLSPSNVSTKQHILAV